MRVRADLELCIGAGVCVRTVARVFDQSIDDGTVRVLVDRVDPADEELVRQAVDRCPAAALAVDDDDEGTS